MFLSKCGKLMGVKEGDEIDTYEASKEKELGNWAILMDYKDYRQRKGQWV